MCDELLPLFQNRKFILPLYWMSIVEHMVLLPWKTIEYIVGNIQDEYDDEERNYRNKENHYIVDGSYN